MPFFKKERKERTAQEALSHERLDLRLLQNGAVALYHKHSVLSDDVAWFQRAGYRVYTLDAAHWATPADFHEAAKETLEFPVHYIANLAGWIDCLGDLTVPRESGVVLQIRHFDAFARAQPQFAHTLLDSIESSSRRFLVTGRRLLALVQSDDARIRFERVGAMPVTWNPREWLDSDRGLRATS